MSEDVLVTRVISVDGGGLTFRFSGDSAEIDFDVILSDGSQIMRTVAVPADTKLAKIFGLLESETARTREGSRRRSQALAAAIRTFEFIELLLPRRMRDEEIGDALETICRLAANGCPVWKIYLKMTTTLFWLCVNAIREVIAS